MANNHNCPFCNRTQLEWRAIRSSEVSTSFVSRPSFRAGHCLVIPNRHIETIPELIPEESAAIIAEIGRLSNLLDEGYGSGVMQKHQPTRTENGIKVNHLHFHVFPRVENEPALFPVPVPNAFEGFTIPEDDEVMALAKRLK